MDDFYRNRSARLSDEIKRVINETRVSNEKSMIYYYKSLSYLSITSSIIHLIQHPIFINKFFKIKYHPKYNS